MAHKRFTIHASARSGAEPSRKGRFKKDVYVVILVGGKGKRLRPLSTDAKPKAFISVTKDRKTMFRRTLDRARKITPSANIIVAAAARHEALVRKDFPGISKRNLILEPVSRNTAPAVAVAASILNKRRADTVMLVMHSDQYIIGEKEYLDSVRLGVDFTVSRKGAIAIMGIRPSVASTGLGYIKVAGGESGAGNVVKAKKFVEKPDAGTAKEYLASGNYLWNAGIFLFSPATILAAFKKHAPEIFELAESAAGIERVYEKMPDISIDHAVLEKASGIYCVKGSYRWRDLGSFENIREVLERESRDFVLKDEKIIKIL
jgi:mannose-1-phosphate guanylyltransferase